MLTRPDFLTIAFAQNSDKRNDIPSATVDTDPKNLASFTQGFPEITMTPKVEGGLPPFGRDMNGILYTITDILRYGQSGAFYPFNADFANAIGGYEKGAFVKRDGGLWTSTAENNKTNPETLGSSWQPEGSGITTINVTQSSMQITNAQAANPILIISGALTANTNIFLPVFLRSWVIMNTTTGNYTLTLRTRNGSGVALPALSRIIVFCDGKNIVEAGAAGGDTIPPGTVNWFAGKTAPEGWLVANGALVSRTLYPKLFAAIGTIHGAGDGKTTFALPNLIGEFIRGANGAAVGTKSACAIQSHTHTATQKSHSHGITDNGHSHGITQSAHSHTATQGAHSHGITDNGHSHGVTDNGHTHGYDKTPIIATFAGTGGAWWGQRTSSFTNGTTASSRAGISIQSAKTGVTIANAQPAVTVNNANANISVNSAKTGVTTNNAQPAITVNAAGGDETYPRHVNLLPVIKI